MARTLRPLGGLVPSTLLALTLLAAVSPAQAQAPATPAPTPAPKMVIPETVADLGEVARGEKVSRDFIIRNEGNATLEIKEVRPACGCTVVNFDKTIPPGGTGKLSSVLDTKSITGGTVKTISVITNDAERPHVELSLMVKSTDYLTFNPGFARFVKGQGYEPGTVKQILYAVDMEDLQVQRIESPYPFLKVDYREAKPEERWRSGKGKQWVVDLTLDYDAAPVGAINANVAVVTNHPKQKQVLLPVSGFIRPRMAMTPPVIDFGELAIADGATQKLVLTNFTPGTIEITSTEVKAIQNVSVTVSPLELDKKQNPYQKFQVEVVLPNGMPKGEFAGELRVVTSAAKNGVVVVPIKGKVL